jgi:hypothetical protein
MYETDVLDPLEEQLKLLDDQIEWYKRLGTTSALAEVAKLEAQRAVLAGEYADQQERILRLQEQQQRLGLLSEQIKLLELIDDYGLDRTLLQGLNLGLDVDTATMIETMTMALQRIVESLNQQVSGYQMGGQFTVQGPGGIDNIPVRFMASAGEVVTVTPPAQPAPMAGGGGQTVNVSFAPSIYSRMDEAEFEARVLGVVNQALRMQ